jgi:predicted enzyme related to lactoylglutathione lyase
MGDEMIESIIIILYVADQSRSRDFYSAVLESAPALDVPGMTEFKLSDRTTLGLMPESGIARIISPPCAHPSAGAGIPRAEIYIRTDDPELALVRAEKAGAVMISPVERRDWDDFAGYCADPDGHIVAFAKKPNQD